MSVNITGTDYQRVDVTDVVYVTHVPDVRIDKNSRFECQTAARASADYTDFSQEVRNVTSDNRSPEAVANYQRRKRPTGK